MTKRAATRVATARHAADTIRRLPGPGQLPGFGLDERRRWVSKRARPQDRALRAHPREGPDRSGPSLPAYGCGGHSGQFAVAVFMRVVPVT